jgi:hypothetical protein
MDEVPAWPQKTRFLIAAIVAANCLPWLFYRLDDSLGGRYLSTGSIATNFFFALRLGQLSMLAIWAAFGGKPLAWRFCYLLACVALLTRIRIAEPTRAAWDKVHDLFVVQWEYALGMALCLVVFRAAGVRISGREPRFSASCDADRWGTWRFRLIDWFWGMVGLGFFLSLWMHLLSFEDGLRCFWPSSFKLFWLCGTALTLTCLWLALGTGWLTVRFAAFGLALILSGWRSYAYDRFLPYLPYFEVVVDVLAWTLPMALWLLGNLYLFRLAGCRLRWR